MKKILFVFLALTLFAALTFALTACGTPDEELGGETGDGPCAQGHTDMDGNEICEVCNKKFISQGLTFILQDDNTYAVTDVGTCTDTDIYIPNEYNGLPVTSIGDSAFEYCSRLKDVYYTGSAEEWE